MSSISTSYVKYFAPSYVKFLTRQGPIWLLWSPPYARGNRACIGHIGAMKPSTQPLSCRRESRVFSLYLRWRVSFTSSLAAIPCLRAFHPSVLFGIALRGQLWAIGLALFYIVCMRENILYMQTLCQ